MNKIMPQKSVGKGKATENKTNKIIQLECREAVEFGSSVWAMFYNAKRLMETSKMNTVYSWLNLANSAIIWRYWLQRND